MLFRCILFICVFLPLACASNNQQHHIERGNNFVLSGDDACAAAEFEKALSMGAPNSRSLWELEMVTGDCYARMKEYKNALKHYECAEAAMEKDYKKFLKLAEEEREPDLKREYLNIIDSRILPLKALAYVAQARIYFALGRDEACSAAAQLALICDDGNLVARMLFARSLEKRGEYKRALKEWTAFLTQAKKFSPSEREARSITEKEISEAMERVSDLLSRQTEKSTP